MMRFSSIPSGPAAPGLLVQDDAVYARRKTEYNPAKRTVFLAEHLLVFVVKGTKFLHLPGRTLNAAPNSLILLKRGVHVMAEYIEAAPPAGDRRTGYDHPFSPIRHRRGTCRSRICRPFQCVPTPHARRTGQPFQSQPRNLQTRLPTALWPPAEAMDQPPPPGTRTDPAAANGPESVRYCALLRF